ncbi:hypothetical protein EVAR_16393_1 [Eumeta japonica]|uniref:Uncharacterized protein n=1 Tax=Eumeta variegata TaxID=151549 RepID=A0A4C1VWS9_EUMVA|nr:hypothetical protein EVAR_16393_1 [Eumeta japonica]
MVSQMIAEDERLSSSDHQQDIVEWTALLQIQIVVELCCGQLGCSTKMGRSDLVRYCTLIEYRREVAVSIVVLRPVTESYGDPLSPLSSYLPFTCPCPPPLAHSLLRQITYSYLLCRVKTFFPTQPNTRICTKRSHLHIKSLYMYHSPRCTDVRYRAPQMVNLPLFAEYNWRGAPPGGAFCTRNVPD